MPACGFSLGLERILVVMTERGMFPDDVTASAADVLVTLWNAETVGESLTLARQLRAAGLRVEVYPDADKIGKQLKYASSRHARYAVIAGDDERAKGSVMVKNLDQRRAERSAARPTGRLVRRPPPLKLTPRLSFFIRHSAFFILHQ